MISGPFDAHINRTVTISCPKPVVLLRGPQSGKKPSPVSSLRLGYEETAAVDKVAALLGMNRSNFIRWCCYEVALDILKQKANYDRKQR